MSTTLNSPSPSSVSVCNKAASTTSTTPVTSSSSSLIIKANNLSQHEALLGTQEHYDTFLDGNTNSNSNSIISTTTTTDNRVWIKPDPRLFADEDNAVGKALVERFQQQQQLVHDEHSLTLQLFPDTTICQYSQSDMVLSAVISTLQELKRSHVDLLLIKVSNTKHIMRYWSDMELLVEHNLVKQIGVCDFNVSELEELSSKVKIQPNVVQVNLASYESIESLNDLAQYCSTRNIKVLTGSRGSLNDFINAGSKAAGSSKAQLNWVVRYSLLTKKTSVVNDMGFIVKMDGYEKCACISNPDETSL